MNSPGTTERVQTLVIGGGQAGLSVGYHLARRGLPFLILEAHERIGDSWRKRWDSLRLFTPARFDGLDGMPFPAPSQYCPTKDEMADYLEDYARQFQLPVRTHTKVNRLWKQGGSFVAEAEGARFEADNVVVAMATHQQPRRPPLAEDMDPAILQFTTGDYKSPDQLRTGDVLVVGAGNSGAEIALDVSKYHRTWLSGRHPGHIPFDIEGTSGRLLAPFVARVFFHRLATVKTPIGRKLHRRMVDHGHPVARAKPPVIAAAGIDRVPRVTGARDGRPLLGDGRTLDVANVIWCTGYQPDFSWIDLPVFDGQKPLHERGVVKAEPGLYFLGLIFLYAASSAQIHGVGRDAAYIARHVAERVAQREGAADSGTRAQGLIEGVR